LAALSATANFQPIAHRGLEIIDLSGFVTFANQIEANPSLRIERTTTGFVFEELLTTPTTQRTSRVNYDTRVGSRTLINGVYSNCDDNCIGLGMGNTNVDIVFTRNATPNLVYSTYGDWQHRPLVGLSRLGVFATGIPTTTAQLPTTGTATYAGSATGRIMGAGVFDPLSFTGTTTLNADFAARTISGTVGNIRTANRAGTVTGIMNSIALTGGTFDGVGFSGTAAATAAPAGTTFDITGATGQFGGQFYGPNAAEAAGSFAVKTPTANVIGSFGAKR
jgi:hypothetical protein